jgi:hypothetical protein
MITPATYGFGSPRFTFSAYYWEGIAANGTKNNAGGTQIVEAGWLAGLGWSAPSSSNLPTPKVFVYSSPGSNTPSGRFTTPRFPNFVGMWGGRWAVFPTTFGSWQVWGPPSNAT